MVLPTELPAKKFDRLPSPGHALNNIPPPLELRDRWDVSVVASPYTVERAYPNFDPNPGDPGRHVHNKTYVQVLR